MSTGIEWCCSCCGAWVADGNACPRGARLVVGPAPPAPGTLREALAEFIKEWDIGYGAQAGNDCLEDAERVLDFISEWLRRP